MPVTDKQRRHLKGMAHHLNPVVIIGQNGLTDGVLNEIGITLETHELIKVRLNAGGRDERQGMIQRICSESGAELIQSIGHIGVFYLRHPEKPKIKLPA